MELWFELGFELKARCVGRSMTSGAPLVQDALLASTAPTGKAVRLAPQGS